MNQVVLDAAYLGILQLAQVGEFGRPIDPDALARAFVQVGESESFHAFLDHEMPANVVELHAYAQVLARRIIEGR